MLNPRPRQTFGGTVANLRYVGSVTKSGPYAVDVVSLGESAPGTQASKTRQIQSR